MHPEAMNALNPAETDAHATFCAAIVESLSPESAIEIRYAQSIAEDHWRLTRARSIETGLFTMTQSHPAEPFTSNSRALELLTRYRLRVHRAMELSLKQLHAVQAVRREAERVYAWQREQALEEAALLLQLNDLKGLPYDLVEELPALHGFVFSNAEIRAFQDRQRQLRQARMLASLHDSDTLGTFAPNLETRARRAA